MSDENKIYFGKIKKLAAEDGNKFFSGIIESPKPYKQDKTSDDPEAKIPDEYHKGRLIWAGKNGDLYQVLGFGIAGVSEAAAKYGFVHSLFLNLGNKWHVEKVEN